MNILKNKTKIVLCTDNDEAGLSLRNELARRFGSHRCQYVEFGEYKDANEVLVKKGGQYLRKLMIHSAKDFPIEGIINIDNIWQSVLNYNENGVENFIGLDGSDNYFKMSFGEWSVVFWNT